MVEKKQAGGPGEMDELDFEIFEALQHNARLTSEELSKKLNISGTIRRRLRKLLKENTIRIVAIGDFSKLGLTLMMGIRMEVRVDKISKITQELSKYQEIQSLAITSGCYNISMLGIFSDNNAYQKFMQNVIAKLKGIKSLETMVFLDIVKGRFIWGAE
jgi:DNA-binding Lrp family transcriptional regulator